MIRGARAFENEIVLTALNDVIAECRGD